MANLTRKTIMSTFAQMLEEMPFDKITVTALSKRAGISHNTFYYNYQDIYALLDAWLTEELGKYIPAQNEGNWQAMLKNLLLACKERRKLIYHIFNGLSRDNLERYAFSATDLVFYPYVREVAEGKNASEKQLQDIANFCRYAFLGFFLEFLWNNMAYDEEEMSERIYCLLSGFVADSIDRLP